MKKRGFTLIELLAVIVVLAVIALITVPLLLNVIDKAKKGAAKASALNYADAVEKYMVLSQIDNTKIKLVPGKVYYLSKNEELSFLNLIIPKVYAEDEEIYLNDIVTVKGEKPDKGWVIVSDKKIQNYSFVVDNFVVTKDKDIVKGNTPEEPSDGTTYKEYKTGTKNQVDTIYYNPVDNAGCTVAEYNDNTNASKIGNNTGCMKWFVIKESSKTKETVDVILDHNITSAVAWNLTGNTANGMAQVADALKTDTNLWNKDLNRRLITADEVAHIVGADREDTVKFSTSKTYDDYANDLETQSSMFRLDGGKNSNLTSYSSTDGWQKTVAKTQGVSDYTWLYNYTDGCTSYGCDVAQSGSYGYWTSNGVTGKSFAVWIVSSMGTISYGDANSNSFGVRPVITISKSILK